jgi:hypothetical protein
MIDPKPDNDRCQYKGLLTRAQVQMHELCAVKYKSFAKKKRCMIFGLPKADPPNMCEALVTLSAPKLLYFLPK